MAGVRVSFADGEVRGQERDAEAEAGPTAIVLLVFDLLVLFFLNTKAFFWKSINNTSKEEINNTSIKRDSFHGITVNTDTITAYISSFSGCSLPFSNNDEWMD